MDQNEKMEKDVISLLDEDGKEHEFEILDALEMASRSTLPPPMVPTNPPSENTAIRAPAPLGVEPELAMIVHSAACAPLRI